MPHAQLAERSGEGPEGPVPSTGRPALLRRLDGALVAVVALGVALRAWGLGAQSLWFDEWLTAQGTSGGLDDLVHHVANREGITPPYFAVMWVWARVVGDGDAALRSFSALVGAATVPVAYALARELGQARRVARAAALLVAVNPLLVWYSQEARPYSLLAFVGALSVLATVRVDRTGRRVDALAWGLAAAGAAAVHYFGLFLVAGEGAALLARRRVPPRRVALGAACVGLVLVVLAPFAVEQHSHAANREWISDFSLRSRVDEAVRGALVGPSPGHDRLWLVVTALVVGAGVVAGRRVAGRDLRAAGALAGLGGLAVVLPLAVSVAGLDVFLGRYVIAGLVPLLTAAAVVLVAARSSRLAWLGGAAVVLVAGMSVAVDAAVARDPQLQRADWRDVAAVVSTGSPDGVLVVDVGSGQSSPLARYLPGATTLEVGDTVTTDQVDVLVGRPSDAPCNFLVGRACALVFLGAPLPPAAAGEFRLDRRVELGQFVVERYRADEPVEVGRSDLLAPGDRATGHVWVR